jgi:hypothetical protein
MTWLERNRVRYIFGLAGNRVLLDRTAALAEDVAVRRAEEDADKVRNFHDFRYAAKSWKVERRVIARIEATRQGSDTRFVVTNLAGTPRWLYEVLYCGRGQAENLIKAHKLHLASDRTSCTKATANQFRLLVHTAAYWLLHTLRGPGTQDLVLARRAVRHPPPRLRQDRRPRHRNGHPHQGLAAVELSLQAEPRPLRRPCPRLAAMTAGQRAHHRARSRPPPTPSSKTENAHRAPPSPTLDCGRQIALMNKAGYMARDARNRHPHSCNLHRRKVQQGSRGSS